MFHGRESGLARERVPVTDDRTGRVPQPPRSRHDGYPSPHPTPGYGGPGYPQGAPQDAPSWPGFQQRKPETPPSWPGYQQQGRPEAPPSSWPGQQPGQQPAGYHTDPAAYRADPARPPGAYGAGRTPGRVSRLAWSAPPAEEQRRRQAGTGPKRGRRWMLIIPLVAPLLSPLTNTEKPLLWGIPFFYWYQMFCAVLATIVIVTVFVSSKERR
jgi:hypothetical protein